jgi:hypothetical protein
MKLPTWRVEQLERQRQRRARPNRRPRNAVSVLARLQDGAALHSGFVNGKRGWMLSDGTVINSRVAVAVTRNPCVAAVDDSLFREDIRGQTWRYIED